MTRHVDVAESELVRGKIPLLAGLAAGIGDPAVRNRGTIGGSVANNDPSADYPAAVLALDATVVTDRREIAADAYFRGLFETALDAGRDHHRLALPGAVRRRATPNSNRRRHAMRWSACVWRSKPERCGSR